MIFSKDGGYTHQTELTKFFKENSSISIFPIGVGYAINRHILRHISNETRGAAEFITPDHQEMDTSIISTKVKRQLDKILFPLKDIRIEWSNFENFYKSPKIFPPLADQSKYLFYLLNIIFSCFS